MNRLQFFVNNSGVSRIRPWEGGCVQGQIGLQKINKLILINIIIFEMTEISPIKVNSNNTMKIHIIETLFARYLLTELIHYEACLKSNETDSTKFFIDA